MSIFHVNQNFLLVTNTLNFKHILVLQKVSSEYIKCVKVARWPATSPGKSQLHNDRSM